MSYELIPNIRRKAYRNWVTTNTLGFRGTEPTGKPLIAVFGDSITFGYGVADSETLPAQLQKLLPAYDVLNTAAPAYQLLQQTAILQEKILPLAPEAIALVFYWNDFTTLTPRLDDDGVLREEGTPKNTVQCAPITEGILSLVPGQCWLQSHSAFYKAFVKLLRWRTGLQELQQQRVASQQEPTQNDVPDEELQIYAEQLQAFASVIPKETKRMFIIWPDRFLHNQSRPMLKNIAQEKGFTVIDLYDIFGNEVPVLGWDTVHPTAAALEKAAQHISQEWTKDL